MTRRRASDLRPGSSSARTGRGRSSREAAGMVRPPVLDGRVGLTWHVADEPGDPVREARMVVLPGRRVLRPRAGAGRPGQRRDRARRPGVAERLQADGAAAVGGRCSTAIPPVDGDPERLAPTARSRDAIAGASPLGSRVERRAGPGWLRRRRRGRVPRPVHRGGAPPGARQRASSRPRRSTRSCAARRPPAALAAYDRAMASGSPRRTSSRGSSRRSSPGRRCSPTPAGGSRDGTTSVRRWAS